MKSFELIQSQSIKKLLQDAENGDAEAQWRLGEAYREGKEVKQDFVEAVKWYRLAAEQGYDRVQAILGRFYVFGPERDDVEAVKWFRLAADQGLDQAQYSLGLAYWHAEGVGLDRAEAVKWIRLAAEQGHDLCTPSAPMEQI